jgi:hypothetical protein
VEAEEQAKDYLTRDTQLVSTIQPARSLGTRRAEREGTRTPGGGERPCWVDLREARGAELSRVRGHDAISCEPSRQLRSTVASMRLPSDHEMGWEEGLSGLSGDHTASPIAPSELALAFIC